MNKGILRFVQALLPTGVLCCITLWAAHLAIQRAVVSGEQAAAYVHLISPVDHADNENLRQQIVMLNSEPKVPVSPPSLGDMSALALKHAIRLAKAERLTVRDARVQSTASYRVSLAGPPLALIEFLHEAESTYSLGLDQAALLSRDGRAERAELQLCLELRHQ